MKTLSHTNLRMAALLVGLFVSSTTLFAQQANELTGFWERAIVTNKGTDEVLFHPNKYYKAIGDNSFILIDIPENSKSKIRGNFTAKGGACKRISADAMIEGSEAVCTYKNGRRMVTEWTDQAGSVIVEEWQPTKPKEYFEKIIAVLTSQPEKKNPFTGVWQMKKQYVMSESTKHYTAVDEKYKVVGDDMYVGFYTAAEVENLGYMRGWYGRFEYHSDNLVSENGAEPTQIIWAENGDEFTFIYCPSDDKRPENFIYEIWTRAELPAYAKLAFEALKGL